jgi:hypothetical protein
MVAGVDRIQTKGLRRNKALRSCQITPTVTGEDPVAFTHSASAFTNPSYRPVAGSCICPLRSIPVGSRATRKEPGCTCFLVNGVSGLHPSGRSRPYSAFYDQAT